VSQSRAIYRRISRVVCGAAQQAARGWVGGGMWVDGGGGGGGAGQSRASLLVAPVEGTGRANGLTGEKKRRKKRRSKMRSQTVETRRG
jgi:hypothetical protein